MDSPSGSSAPFQPAKFANEVIAIIIRLKEIRLTLHARRMECVTAEEDLRLTEKEFGYAEAKLRAFEVESKYLKAVLADLKAINKNLKAEAAFLQDKLRVLGKDAPEIIKAEVLEQMSNVDLKEDNNNPDVNVDNANPNLNDQTDDDEFVSKLLFTLLPFQAFLLSFKVS
jgi:hypothetical protein